MWLVVTEVTSESFGLVTERHHYNARPIYGYCSSVGPVVFFIVECSIVHFLCACVCYACIRRWASSSPLGYPCAKFCFRCTPHCLASLRRKLCTKSVTQVNHSVTQLIWFARNRSFHFGIRTCLWIKNLSDWKWLWTIMQFKYNNRNSSWCIIYFNQSINQSNNQSVKIFIWHSNTMTYKHTQCNNNTSCILVITITVNK